MIKYLLTCIPEESLLKEQGALSTERKLQQLSMGIYRDDKSIRAVQTFGMQGEVAPATEMAPAVGDGEGKQKAPPRVDTRIHWKNEDEGWVGGSSNTTREIYAVSIIGPFPTGVTNLNLLDLTSAR
ncbi:hypothetical protein Tco_0886662 [Tanacetum coccineum]